MQVLLNYWLTKGFYFFLVLCELGIVTVIILSLFSLLRKIIGRT